MRITDEIQENAFKKLKGKNSFSVETSIYDVELNSLSGQAFRLDDYKGKFLLIVNVASKCGFTKQYKALQKLYDTHKDRLVVIGLPCNQFGNQEPGSSETIQEFCDVRFGVTFPLTEKVQVKGPDQHPLYKWLTKKSQNGKKSSSVHWNFQKYLIDPEGHLVDVFYSTTSPTSKKITRHLKIS